MMAHIKWKPSKEQRQAVQAYMRLRNPEEDIHLTPDLVLRPFRPQGWGLADRKVLGWNVHFVGPIPSGPHAEYFARQAAWKAFCAAASLPVSQNEVSHWDVPAVERLLIWMRERGLV